MKTYVKPDLYYENFELSNSVAGGCVDPLNHTQDSCSISLEEKLGISETLFSSNCDNDYRTSDEMYCEYSAADFNLISVFTS